MNISYKFTNKTSIVELSPFSSSIDDGKEIVIFFTNPLKFGFGYKTKTVKNKVISLGGIRIKWYGWKTLPYVKYK